VEIHDGEYNNIKVWDYVKFAEALSGGDGRLWAARVSTEGQLAAAISEARSRTDQLAFIEVMLHRDDCSKELLVWGSRVAANNGRAPNKPH